MNELKGTREVFLRIRSLFLYAKGRGGAFQRAAPRIGVEFQWRMVYSHLFLRRRFELLYLAGFFAKVGFDRRSTLSPDRYGQKV